MQTVDRETAVACHVEIQNARQLWREVFKHFMFEEDGSDLVDAIQQAGNAFSAYLQSITGLQPVTEDFLLRTQDMIDEERNGS